MLPNLAGETKANSQKREGRGSRPPAEGWTLRDNWLTPFSERGKVEGRHAEGQKGQELTGSGPIFVEEESG